MTNFQKLKHEARRAEQRSDWARAIDLYRRALDTDEDMTDLSLYNRIGDLHHRQGQTDEAVESYELAVERYAENGMQTSAIALCNKILRIAPDRESVFRRLARLHAQTGLLVEGRANCMAYVRRRLEDDAVADAREAIEEFAHLSGDDEIRLQFAEALAGAGDDHRALEQLEAVHDARRERGIEDADLAERIVALGGEATAAKPSEGREVDAGSDRGPVDLAALVARDLASAGNAAGFDPSPPPPGPEPRRAGEDGLDAVRRLVGGFREEVRHVLEGADLSIRYDLGIEFMTIGLLEEAIEEFRTVVANPGLVEAASARIAECMALQNAGESFASVRPTVASVPTGSPPRTTSSPGEAGSREEVQASLAQEPDAPVASGFPGSAAWLVDEAGTVTAATSGPAEDGPVADGGHAAAEPDGDDELQGHFFRARLAQYRIRRAEERHTTDHAGHLDLGTAYIEMELRHEAVRELGVALLGPRAVATRAARSLGSLVAEPDTSPELALHALALLAGSDFNASVSELGAALAGAWGPGHELGDRLAELLGEHAASTDELPSLEAMFPALAGPQATPPPAAEIDAPADASPTPVPAPPTDAEEPDPGPATTPDSPGSDSGMRAEDLAELDELLSQLDDAGLDSAATVESELEEAGQFAAAGDPGAAADLLTSVLERLEGEHRVREAITVLDRLIALRPDDVMLHHHRTELALMVNSRAMLLSSYAELGACLRRNDTARNARAAYGRMLDIDPTNARAKAAIAEIDAEEVNGERRDREGSPSAARENGGHAEFDALLEALDPGGDEEDGHFLRSNDTDGVDDGDPVASSHHDLGLAFQQMGMWEEAARELAAALEGVSDRLGVLEALGECLVKAGRGGEAVTLLEHELRADEDVEQVGALYWLGIALQSVGNAAAARATFTRIETASPGYRDSAGRLAELSL